VNYPADDNSQHPVIREVGGANSNFSATCYQNALNC